MRIPSERDTTSSEAQGSLATTTTLVWGWGYYDEGSFKPAHTRGHAKALAVRLKNYSYIIIMYLKEASDSGQIKFLRFKAYLNNMKSNAIISS